MKKKSSKLSRYADSFKRKLIEEYLTSEQSQVDVERAYGVPGHSAIRKWMKKFGYAEKPGLTFDRQIFPTLKKQKDEVSNEELLKRIKSLERRLEDEKLRSELYERIIDKAEKEMKIPIRKKPGTR
jgi:transposase